MAEDLKATWEALLSAGASPGVTERAIQEIPEHREQFSALAKDTRQLVWMTAALLALTVVLSVITWSRS